jgi:hypothetical protein
MLYRLFSNRLALSLSREMVSHSIHEQRTQNSTPTKICGFLCIAESIVSYSAPRGEVGSPLEDLSYDGVLDGSHMRGGLGQLVDGLYGDDHIQDHTPGRLSSVCRNFAYQLSG